MRQLYDEFDPKRWTQYGGVQNQDQAAHRFYQLQQEAGMMAALAGLEGWDLEEHTNEWCFRLIRGLPADVCPSED